MCFIFLYTMPVGLWRNIEYSDRSGWFENISNSELFGKSYENLKKRYWYDFSVQEKKLIEWIWNKWVNEYKGNPSSWQIRIIENRLDNAIFEYRNPKLISINKYIRQIPNATEQRKYRGESLRYLSSIDERKIWELEDLFHFNKQPDLDSLRHIFSSTNESFSETYKILDREIENRSDNMPEYLKQIQNRWKREQEREPFLRQYDQYLSSALQEVDSYFFSYVWDKDFVMRDEDQEEIIRSLRNRLSYVHSFNLQISSHSLFECMSNTIMRAIWLGKFFENNKYDPKVFEDIQLDDEDNQDVEYLSISKIWYALERSNIRRMNKLKKYLERKKKDGTLTESEQRDLDNLTIFFEWARQMRKVYEWCMSNTIYTSSKNIENHDIWSMNLLDNTDYIVSWNIDIQKFIYDNRTSWTKAVQEWDSEIQNFLVNKDENIAKMQKYIKSDGTIDSDKARQDRVDENSIRKTQDKFTNIEMPKFIWSMNDKNKIAQKTAIMKCCFNAISRFFDTTNSRWENFAEDFKFDVNQDVSFDWRKISMKWTIWWNYIWLYYDLDSWNLLFDKFIDFDAEKWHYVIWENNGKRENREIHLPTLTRMYDVSNNIDYNQVLFSEKVDGDLEEYEKSLSEDMEKLVRSNCFQNEDFVWKKMAVEEINERNILRQDILKNIYSKFYKTFDIDELFKWQFFVWKDKPWQFKLVDLIARSIDNCKSSFELLRFRDLISRFDKYITNPDIVKKDKLLVYLFTDNRHSDNDIYDTSREILEWENWKATNWNVVEHRANGEETYSKNSKDINYYTFLDLVSGWEDGKRLINLDAFSKALEVINTEWKSLSKNSEWLFFENYYDMAFNGELPDFNSWFVV